MVLGWDEETETSLAKSAIPPVCAERLPYTNEFKLNLRKNEPTALAAAPSRQPIFKTLAPCGLPVGLRQIGKLMTTITRQPVGGKFDFHTHTPFSTDTP